MQNMQLLLLFNHSTSGLALVGKNAQYNALYTTESLFLACTVLVPAVSHGYRPEIKILFQMCYKEHCTEHFHPLKLSLKLSG